MTRARVVVTPVGRGSTARRGLRYRAGVSDAFETVHTTFDRVEAEEIGQGVHDKYHHLAEELAAES